MAQRDWTEKYSEISERVREQLVVIEGLLNNHNQAFDGERFNFGYVGDLHHAADSLSDVIQFLRNEE